MTGIDSETSQDIAEAISLKGGRYLEAQIQGSKTQVSHVSFIGDSDNMINRFSGTGWNPGYFGFRRSKSI